ncbi:MAG: UDP-N-acetylglucosamine--N-acetylmuramyl-(pentapeptide) pyrophosphoryl-undecaprenol N-acetylglucosamine transferase, partial [Actinomycetota bacterium]
MRVLVAAGGTAGHVLPAIALARTLAEGGDEVRFIGTASGQEARLVPAAGFPFRAIDARPIPRSVSLRMVASAFADVRAIGASRGPVRDADVVVGFGGYASVPVGLAAARSGRPLVLHEQNAVPGLATRLLARRASFVALSFPEAAGAFGPRFATRFTGIPVRRP